MGIARRLVVGGKELLILIVTLVLAIFITLFAALSYQNWDINRSKSERGFEFESYSIDLTRIKHFEKLQEIDPEKNDGLRFYVSQFGGWQYLISAEEASDGSLNGAIDGVLTSHTLSEQDEAFSVKFSIVPPESSDLLAALSEPINDLNLAWAPMCSDGTTTTYERWKNGEVMSGNGNAECVTQYAELVSLIDDAIVKRLPDVPPDLPASIRIENEENGLR